MSTPTPPSAPQASPAKKKGLHPMAWAGIGCGGILALVILGIAFMVGFAKRKIKEIEEDFAQNPERKAAELIVGLSPEIEMVSEDEESGEMTIRVKESGDEITVSYADLANGKFTITSPDGTTTSIGAADPSKVPAWVPRYPNILEQQSVFHQEKATVAEGIWMFTTADNADEVVSFFEGEASWSTNSGSSTMSLNGSEQRTADYSGGGKELKISVTTTSGSPCQVTLNYKGAKP